MSVLGFIDSVYLLFLSPLQRSRSTDKPQVSDVRPDDMKVFFFSDQLWIICLYFVDFGNFQIPLHIYLYNKHLPSEFLCCTIFISSKI